MVLIKQKEAETVSKGGLIIPGSFAEKPLEGTIAAVGGGKIMKNGNRIRMDVKVDDEVLFAPKSGVEVILSDVKYLIMREEHILGIVK
jgi:chaperonin GroES